MIPRVGDIVKLNPDFLKIWFKKNKYFRKEVWRENLIVIEIEDLKDESRITFKSKDFKYMLYILSNGEFSSLSNEYKGIQVFIPIFETSIYCSCNGPTKENYVLGKRFYICTICKKEKIQT